MINLKVVQRAVMMSNIKMFINGRIIFCLNYTPTSINTNVFLTTHLKIPRCFNVVSHITTITRYILLLLLLRGK